MLFSGIPFLYYFLPAILLLYFCAPRRWRNLVLLLGSLFFYGWGEPRFVPVLLAEILLSYLCGLGVEKWRTHPSGKLLLCCGVAVLAGMLGFFKFSAFFPLGVSFYTFQAISYLADVYAGRVRAQRSLISFAAYVSLFPQLVAGPIVRYAEIEEQLSGRRESFAAAAEGIRRFLLGLGKKVLLANAFGELCGVFRLSEEKAVLFYWLYAVSFLLQIYFDFSGYSDMAIGLGRIFGFTFPENFRYPYISGSVTEFWRRWHISLGSWFRDYVYIPLGGSRTSGPKWLRNLFLVWLLTGLWHGASWNFILWGLLFAVLLLLERLWLGKYLKKAKVWNHVYLLLAVLVGFVIFDAANVREALEYLGAMFGLGGAPLVSEEFFYYFRSYRTLLLIGCIGATPVPARLAEKARSNPTLAYLCNFLETPALLALLLTVTAYLADGSFNPFLYFRF